MRKVLQLAVLISFLTMIVMTIPICWSPVWSPDMRLTWNAETDWMPSIIETSDGRIWVFWHSYRTGDAEIFYKIYDASQVHPWSPEIRLTNSLGTDACPSAMQDSEGKIWVVWMTYRLGNYEIFYKIYDGFSWSSDKNATANSYRDELPSIMQASDGKVWVVWDSQREGIYDLFYKTTLDNGENWSSETEIPLSSANKDDWDPSITLAADDKIWLTWVRKDNILCGFYDGASWSSVPEPTTDPGDDWHPSIMQAGDGKIWVIWDSDRISYNGVPQTDIFYSSYDGVSWSSPPEQLTTDPEEDVMPSIMQDKDETFWIAWTSDRTSNSDIYYGTTSTPPAHDVEIFSVIPSESSVYRGESISIEVVARNHGNNNETIEVTCYVNSASVGMQTVWDLVPGQLHPMYFTWYTSGFDYGKYTVSATATPVVGETNTADNVFTDGVVSVDSLHDVAVTDLTPAKTVVGQGYTISINVTVQNEGIHDETFDLTAYRNANIIDTQTVALEAGDSATFTFPWNTTDVARDSYILSANATSVPDEGDIADNTCVDGTVTVTIPGDVNGDRIVDIHDLAKVSRAYGSKSGDFNWDPNADIDGDGAIDSYDLAICDEYYGETDL